MARGSSQASGAATSAQNLSNSLQGQSTGLYNTLAPELQSEAAAPSGFSPADMARMKTDAQQTAGGTQAAAVGQGALLAARTRNAGGPDAAIAQASRGAGRQLSEANLGTDVANARLKEQQRQAGLSGEENLYGRTLGGATQALGEVAPNVNADTNAKSQSWDWTKYLLDPLIQAGGQSGAAALGG